VVVWLGLAWSGWAVELLPAGHRPAPVGWHALVGGKVVVKPGQVLEEATIIIRDGYLVAVGSGIEVPAGAQVWTMQGTRIYAGFIEPYLVLGATNVAVRADSAEAGSLTGGVGGYDFFGVPGQGRDPGGPGPGHAVAGVTPERRAVDAYAIEAKALESLREVGFTVGHVVPGRGILRGCSALVALSDGAPNLAVLAPEVFQVVAFEVNRSRERVFPGSLMGVVAVVRQAFLDARHYASERADTALRSGRGQGQGGGIRPAFNTALAQLGPAAEGRQRVLFEPGSALMMDRAARVARELGLEFALVSSGEEWRRPDLAKGLGATLIVPVDFPEAPKLPEAEDWQQVSLDRLRAWDWAPENPALLRQQGLEVALTSWGLTQRRQFRARLRSALDRGLSEEDALAALTTVPARLCGMAEQLGTVEPGKLANLTVVTGGGYFTPKAKVREVWIDGRIYPVVSEEAGSAKSRGEDASRAGVGGEPKGRAEADAEASRRQRVARSPLAGRGPLVEPPALLIQNATIWTCGPQGRVEEADLFVRGGKIVGVGPQAARQFEEGAGALRLDGRGWHLTPGLIDCHSHSMILGEVNEGTLPSSAMVRIGDVVNSESITIRQQLAGGVTLVNLLHGSANPVGGQNCLIKLRDGAAPEELKVADAPLGIKFALGENVKQANWGERFTTRFPQTRMGVRTFFVNRFTAAQQYLEDWAVYRETGGREPRRDLELEALGEVLGGERWIHCHAYRQDEILTFLRTMEQFRVQVGTLQHILEGYKVADEMAAHGAGASAFSDWWAYKFEVYDAIPYAGSLMRERGVLVSFNSDSSELARRLNLEAAKAVKYGGTSEVEALKFVTANPARQLRIEERVGSLEVGKDADFAVWSGPPLDSRSVCLQTWIEGRKYFDRESAAAQAQALEQERSVLIEKAKQLASAADRGKGAEAESDAGRFWRCSLETEHDGWDRHCTDE